jgi:hypothetical protein
MQRKVLLVSLGLGACLIASAFILRSKAIQPELIKITYSETKRTPHGQTQSMRIRYMELPTGQYKETAYDKDGKEGDSQIKSRLGLFTIAKKNARILPIEGFEAPRWSEAESASAIEKNAVGVDQIAGFRAYHTKAPSGSVETWTAPELSSNIFLKLIMHSADGVSFTQLEAAAVSREGATPAGFFDLPDLPVDTSKLERALEAAQERRDQRGVERYNRLLKQWKK